MSKITDILQFVKTTLEVPSTRYPSNPKIDISYRLADIDFQHLQEQSLDADIQITVFKVEYEKIGELEKDWQEANMFLLITLYTHLKTQTGSDLEQDGQIIAWDNADSAVMSKMALADFKSLENSTNVPYINWVELIEANLLDKNSGLTATQIPIRMVYEINYNIVEEF